MEILSTNDGLLTNIEVLEIIKENQNRIIDHNKELSFNNNLRNKDYIENQVVKYITNSDIGKVDSDVVGICISSIKQLNFNFTEGELLQIANLAPTSLVEYYLIIEDCSDRFTDEQIELISSIVMKHLKSNT